jgi:hypothetical protein
VTEEVHCVQAPRPAVKAEVCSVVEAEQSRYVRGECIGVGYEIAPLVVSVFPKLPSIYLHSQVGKLSS